MYLFLTVILIIFISFIIYRQYDYDGWDGCNASHPLKPLKILNLVLYSPGVEYDKMKNLTSSLYKKDIYIKTLYYTFSDEINYDYKYDYEKDILYIKGKETYLPGILDKTIKAFKYFSDNYHDYDYIIRTNISTVINFNKLSKKLLSFPIHYGGGIVNHLGKNYIDEYNGITKENSKKLENLFYPSGTCMIFSKELFGKMLLNINLIDYSIIDDVSIGHFIKVHLPSYYEQLYNYHNDFLFVDNIDKLDIDKYIFFRNRSHSRDVDVSHIKYITNKIDKLRL